jgi:RNA polymerase sigma-70 factor (ECF subfamily)
MQTQEVQFGDGQNPNVQIGERNTREFQDAVSRQLGALYRRAYRYVGDQHDAEDAVQDALLSAYRHLDQFKGTAKMTTWLTTIVTNSALTQLRRRPRQPHTSLDEQFSEDRDYSMADRLADVRLSPEGEYIQTELRGRLMQYVMKLSPSLRKVLQLRDLDGLTTSEVASIMGVSRGTVKAQASRARTKLKQIMRAV